MVEAAIPDHNTGVQGTLPGDLDGTKWRIVYSVVQTFPAGSDLSMTLALNYVDTPWTDPSYSRTAAARDRSRSQPSLR